MTSSEHTPFKPPFDPSAHRPPGWDETPAIKFSSRGGNTISPVNVTRTIEVHQARFHRQPSDMPRLEALLTTFGRGPATRHLVIVTTLNPSADALGPHGTHVWFTVVERLHQVHKLEATCKFSHRPLCIGRDSGAPDRPISVCDEWSNSLILGPGKFASFGLLDDYD